MTIFCQRSASPVAKPGLSRTLKMNKLLQSCDELPGIGSQTLTKLQKLDIYTIYDLIRHLPFRYQDRTQLTRIADLQTQQSVLVQGQIVESQWRKGKRRIYHCKLTDNSAYIHLKFFHLPLFLQKRLAIGETIRVFGEAKWQQGAWEFIHPEVEFEQERAIPTHLTAWYPSTHGLQQGLWRKLMLQVFDQYASDISNLEWLSPKTLSLLQLPRLDEALSMLHFPHADQSLSDLLDLQHPARCRLALEEFVVYFLATGLGKQAQQTQTATPYFLSSTTVGQLLQQLPFELTQGQVQVHQEIQADLQQPRPMLRLLQGDVGSGKTIVCAMAALAVMQAGHQVALMAPTDLLSEQHYQNMKQWLQPLGFSVVRLNRSTTTKMKKMDLQAIAEGKAQLVIGTHALFQDQVAFQHLGLIIIDEQHRFGVGQRLKLLDKAKTHYPHQLFVTATPIPRTLAMTQFFHFDISILHQVPKGRQPIQTAVMPQTKRDLLLSRLQGMMAHGGQVYWVCTRIDHDEQQEQIAVNAVKDYLQAALPTTRIALVHGKLKANEKDQIMQNFKSGDYDILVATTVIEVGVDVPNANIMIIENAERLGLAQLHQLRGRVGRGETQAFCILLYNPPLSEIGQQRLAIIRQSNDGFWLAEQDLKLRGAGDIFGTQQTGFNDFKYGALPMHLTWLQQAQELAEHLLNQQSPLIPRLLADWSSKEQDFLQS